VMSVCVCMRGCVRVRCTCTRGCVSAFVKGTRKLFCAHRRVCVRKPVCSWTCPCVGARYALKFTHTFKVCVCAYAHVWSFVCTCVWTFVCVGVRARVCVRSVHVCA
jgi:hypothetical protein